MKTVSRPASSWDYGEFSLKGELKELMFLDEPACPKGQ